MHVAHCWICGPEVQREIEASMTGVAATSEMKMKSLVEGLCGIPEELLTFMSGSDSQQVAYTVTLFREAAHKWYMRFERWNRGLPRDWAGLVAALLDRFGSKIRSQEAQSQFMSISQGQRAVRDYANQFETLLGHLDSYDEGLMPNQFIWGFQPDLVRSVSIHYPTSIAKEVSLAKTTELSVKAS